MDLGAPVVARPSSRCQWCSQPKVRSTTQGAPRSEPGSVWRRAICGAVSDHTSTPRTRNRRHRAFSHSRRASDCDRLGSSTSSVSQADGFAGWPPYAGARAANAYSLGHARDSFGGVLLR